MWVFTVLRDCNKIIFEIKDSANKHSCEIWYPYSPHRKFKSWKKIIIIKKHVIIKTHYTRHDHESIWEFPHLQGIKFSCMNTRSSYFESDARSLSACCTSYYLGVARIDRLFWFKVAIGTQYVRKSTSQATRMSATRCVTTQHSSSL